MKDKVARRNDDNITIHHHPSQSNVLILVNNPCNDIRTSRTSVVTEDNTNTEAQQTSSYHTSHEVLSRSQQLRQVSVFILQNHLEKPEQEGQHENGKNGLDTEFRPQYFQGKPQKNRIDYKIRNLDFNARRIINNGSNTRHSSCRNLIRKHEGRPANRITNQAKGYGQIVP